jgi:small GTP-binding protein
MAEFLLKVLVTGENHCGKTSFVKRYVHDVFTSAYKATIGVDFALKKLPWKESTTVRLQLWDIAGQERWSNMTRIYYREAVGAFVVFSASAHRTLPATLKWKENIDQHCHMWDGSPIPVILIMTKCDLPKDSEIPSAEELRQFAATHGFAGFYETTSRERGHQVIPSFFT